MGALATKWGPVLGVTALPASTPITQSVEEFIIDSVYSVFLLPVLRTSVDIFSLGEIGKNLKVEYLRNANRNIMPYRGIVAPVDPYRVMTSFAHIDS